MSNFQEELRSEDGYENIVIIAVGQTNISSFNNNFCANSDLPLVMDSYPDLPIREQFSPYGLDHYLVILDYDGDYIDYINLLSLGTAEKNYIKTNNFAKFFKLPQSRILKGDVNGGEPTASKNYKKLLANLPRKTKIVRMNTNGSRMIKELEAILRNRIMVIVTLSFDGVGDVHDYVRWPIKWEKFTKTIEKYKKLQGKGNQLQKV